MTDRTPDEDDLDDDALHWAGDEARGQAAPRLRDEDREAASAASVAPAPEAVESAPVRAELGVRIVTVGFAVVYLALTVGWVLSVQMLAYPDIDLMGEIMWQFGEFLAMVAPALWFVATLGLTPPGVARHGLVRAGALLLGAVLLLPLPYLLGALG